MSPWESKRRQWIVFGNPENRRVKLFQQALRALGEPSAEVISYLDVLRRDDAWNAFERSTPTPTTQTILRIESPGENAEVERLLIAQGRSRRSSVVSKRHPPDVGRVRRMREWFAGYSALLQNLAGVLERRPDIAVQNHPQAIELLFDKQRCQKMLASSCIQVPHILAGIQSYDELREAMQARRLTRVFVKLAFGSSASGVIAFRTMDSQALAVTSLEIVQVGHRYRFYNNLRISTYRRESELRALFEFVFSQGAYVEQWLPKASIDGRSFDLRVVTIDGKACHCVVRTSRSPITNLHLGNRRGDLDAVRQAAGDRWSIVESLCERAARAIPEAQYVGWDVLVTPGFRSASILEGNAFGDLLPNVLFEKQSTHELAIATMIQRQCSPHAPHDES